MKTIAEKNRMIAEFMGVEFNKIGERYMASPVPNEIGSCWEEHLKYHASWDWLMPVVKKINGLTIGTGDRPFFDMIMTFLEVNEIENAHISVVKFIEFYNENKK